MPKKLFAALTRQAQNKRIRKFLAENGGVKGIPSTSSKPLKSGFEENLSDHCWYDTFEKAEAKTRKACDTSNSETSDEEENRRSRNFRRKRDISQELDFLDGLEVKKKQLAGASRSESPPFPLFPEMNRPADVYIHALPSTPETTNPISTPTITSPPPPFLSNTSEFLVVQGSLTQISRSLTQISRSLTQMSMLWSDMSLSMKELTKKIDDPVREITHEDEGNVRQFKCLPLKEMVEFEMFEKNLSDGMKKQFIKVIRSVGGNDPGQTVNFMLRRIMTDELAMKFSFTGKVMAGKVKKAFGSTEVSKCIIVALRGAYGPDITDSKFSILAGKWFQQAKTRVERRYITCSHHSRSQSVKTPRGVGGVNSRHRPNYLCLPQQRSRVASMPNTGVEEEYYRLRHFSITSKGVVNRGDSLKSRRSRSNTSVASSNSSHSTEHQMTGCFVAGGGSYPGSARTSATASLASSRESSCASCPGITAPYRVMMLGSAGVGKTSLISQFMTSEYLHAYDTSIDDEFGEKSVSVLLDGEESELTFIDHPSSEMSPEDCLTAYSSAHAFCVVYSTSDRASFRQAEESLQALWKMDNIRLKAVILVGNKTDLVRSRVVTTQDGKMMATNYDCKFIETSVGINHNVDELLVGILTQIRLKQEKPPDGGMDSHRQRCRSRSPLGGNGPATMGFRKYRGQRTSASLKVKGLLSKVWARDSKSKSCENLHVL